MDPVTWSVFIKKAGAFLLKVITTPTYLIIMALCALLAYQHFWVLRPVEKDLATALKDNKTLVEERGRIKAELKNKQLALDQEKANNKELEASIQMQNGEIMRLGKERQRMDNIITFMQKDNERIRKLGEKSVQDILNADVPKECQAAADWAIEKGQELGKW